MLEYMKESTLKAAAVSTDSLKPKVDERDFLFSVRKVGSARSAEGHSRTGLARVRKLR